MVPTVNKAEINHQNGNCTHYNGLLNLSSNDAAEAASEVDTL